MGRVGFHLCFGKTQRIIWGTAVGHAAVACIGTLSILATCFGGFFACTDGSASTTVIGIAAVNVDTDLLIIFRTDSFLRILARRQDTISTDTIFEFRTRGITAARCIRAAEIPARHWVDTGTVAERFT